MKKLGYVYDVITYGASPHLWMLDGRNARQGRMSKHKLIASALSERDRVQHAALVRTLEEAAAKSKLDIVSAFEALPVKDSKTQQDVMRSVAEVMHFKILCNMPEATQNAKATTQAATQDMRIWVAIFRDMQHVMAFRNRGAASDGLLDAIITSTAHDAEPRRRRVSTAELRMCGSWNDDANDDANIDDLPEMWNSLSDDATTTKPFIPLLLRIAHEFCDDNKLCEEEEATVHMLTCVYVISDRCAMLCIAPADLSFDDE